MPFEANCTDANCLIAILVPVCAIGLVLLVGVVALAWPIDKKAIEADCDRRAQEEEEHAHMQKIAFRQRMAAAAGGRTWETEGQIQSMSVMSPITGDADQSSPTFPNSRRF